jgi:uncharacterized membrane protein (UPF0182 family)
MPELRLVVLALQDRLAYGPTFEAALASLFGGEVSSLSSNETPGKSESVATASAAPAAATDVNGLIAEAGETFAEYQRLTSAGKLGEAGQQLDKLKQIIDQLNARQK